MEEPRNLLLAAPPWVSHLFGVLSDWLIFLFAMFFTLIASSVALKNFDIAVKVGDAMFFVEIIAAAVVSVFLAGIVGRIATNWLKDQSAFANYLWLGVVILLTLLSFPAVVNFSTVQSLKVPGTPTAQ